ncbi:DUF4055 domain-containing protein [Pseudomonas sp. 10S4]|uniref:DUF4055 domain-containing protein n=1 Tax=Pseudomonas sp. 10S4 TaxID=3048583 RepID=UPI002AC898A5|nr:MULTISPECIES: DUF4055 domain-containing protein [unclassified Pseudomonas]MEB0226266.1 DUF4055 domain-containing protein [Pseudomonas sp. 5S1]MEB0294913.1 DUF4055 domain-containing protein [Pseudomonas sp. 10S4]WPX18142.1 DUF4055 domain-containing protein [Pseudomonas sp. 10S4]
MSNDVSFKRADYIEVLDRWATVRDVCAGQHRVVSRLPYINAHDKSPENSDRNKAYRERAVFKNATGHTRNGLLGLAFHKDPTLTVPKKLEYLQDNANGSGVSIYQHSQGTLEKVLEAGRHGLYVDYHQDEGAGGHSVILSYCAEDIINWRTGMVNGHNVLTLVVLREMMEVEEGFGFKAVEQFRELALEAEGFVCRVWRRAGPKDEGPLEVISTFTPSGIAGRLKEIPFTFVGAQNNDPTIDESPLYDIAMINLGHYRNSADYEDSVFWCGQAQPWISGLTEQWVKLLEEKGVYVGSRAPMLLPVGGAFGYAQPLPNTLVKEAMADKNQMMIELGARMVVASLAAKTATESRGDQSASTSVLAGCVANVSEAYTRAIMWCGLYMGITDKVAYQVNQEFVELTADPQMITALVGLWQNGGFAKADLRAYLRKLGLIAPERTDQQIDGELQEQGDGLGLDDEVTPNGGKPSNS